MLDWREQEVENETDSRAINEVANSSREGSEGHPTNDFVCECSDSGCMSAVTMTPAEYEEVRSDGATFTSARDHENPESTR